jgi:hypothetical protein
MKVFISYRRAGIASAARVYDHLCRRYSPQNVFMDVGGNRQGPHIRAGVDFREELRRHIAAADAVVCIISRAGGLGTRESSEDSDYMQFEVAEAFRLMRRVLPVLVDGGTMPTADQLPPSLRQFSFLQAVELHHERFDDEVQRLWIELSGERWYQRRWIRLTAAAAVLSIALIAWPTARWLTRPTPFKGDRSDIVVDRAGALMWGRVPVAKDVTRNQAVDSCHTLTLGGYMDWRLPDAKELHDAYGFSAVWSQLSLQGLPGLWTSSLEENDNRYAWAIHSNGEPETLEVTERLGVVCVRRFREGEL